MNIQIYLTPEVLQIDAQEWWQIETFISDKFSLSSREGIVVPISGGLDSSVVAALCTRAIGKEKVIGLMLPERLGNPEANYYGQLIAKHLDIKIIKKNISPILRGLGTSNLFLSSISRLRYEWSTRSYLNAAIRIDETIDIFPRTLKMLKNHSHSNYD